MARASITPHDLEMRALSTILASLSVLVVSGCAAARYARPASPSRETYVSPPRDEPHARLMVRVRHHARIGEMFADTVEIDGRHALGASDHDGRAAGVVRIDPGAHTVRVRTEAYDETTRTAIGYTLVSTPVHCDDDCGRDRTCHVEQALPYLYEAADLAPTARCDTALRFRSRARGRYVLDYDVYADGRCELRCRRVDGITRECE